MIEDGLAPQQRRMVVRAEELNGQIALLCEPRVGKSRGALAFLEKARARKVLIVAPVTAAGVWRREAEALHFSLPIYIALQSDLKKRAKALRDWLSVHPESTVITNYGSYWKPEIASILAWWCPDAIVMDEAQALRNRTSKQSKFAHRMAMLPGVKYRLALTGTPITNSIQDAFSLFKFVNPTVFGTRWANFADRYLVFGFFNEILDSKNDEEARQRIAANSIQIARSEAWGGLPKRHDEEYPIILTEESTKRYHQFRKKSIVAIEGVDEEGKRRSGSLQTDLVITQLMRLQQLVSGHTKIDGVVVDISSEKIDAAVAITEQTVDGGEQVALFCAFRREIARLSERLNSRYPNQVGVLRGGRGGDDADYRDRTISAFQRGDLRILISQNQVASKSIDLAAASVGIVVSTGYSLDDFEQLRERLTGTDPNRSFTYFYLQAVTFDGKPTIDKKIYDVLRSKQRMAGKYLTLDYARRMFSDDAEPTPDDSSSQPDDGEYQELS